MAFVVLPLIGAFIGWSTNWLAIRMLFRPREPVRIPFTGYTVQGILPRRRAELARHVGRVVAEELLAPAVLAERLASPAFRAAIEGYAIGALRVRIGALMPPFIPGAIRGAIADSVAEIVRGELGRLLSEPSLPEFLGRAVRDLDVAGAVERRLNELPLDGLEDLVIRLAGRELRYIVLLGALLGFAVGLLQTALIPFL